MARRGDLWIQQVPFSKSWRIVESAGHCLPSGCCEAVDMIATAKKNSVGSLWFAVFENRERRAAGESEADQSYLEIV
jgi:hypothetical protein